jgi:hypothetical protein
MKRSATDNYGAGYQDYDTYLLGRSLLGRSLLGRILLGRRGGALA